MAVRRFGQVGMLFVTNQCFFCWFIKLEELDGHWVIPENCRSDKGICSMHRARLGEGVCQFCGRRVAWLRMGSVPELAICRPCLALRRGKSGTQIVEAMQEGDALGLMVS
jgi:hypothetical protein